MPLINEPYDYTNDPGRHRRRQDDPLAIGCLPYLYVGLVLLVVIVVAGAL